MNDKFIGKAKKGFGGLCCRGSSDNYASRDSR